MPADDPRRSSAGADDQRPGRADDAPEGPERAAATLRYGIDQVADKVKGILRSPR